MHRDICQSIGAARSFSTNNGAYDYLQGYERSHQWLACDVIQTAKQTFVIRVFDNEKEGFLGYAL